MIKILNLIKHPLFSGSALVVVGSNSVNFLNYLYHLLMGRLLGPSGYGELVALISLMGLLGILPSPFNLVVVKYASIIKSRAELNNLVSWLRIKVFQFSILFFILIILISPILYSFLHISNIVYLILIAVPSLFTLLATLNRAIMQGLLMFKQMIFSLILESVSKILISILLIFLSLYLFGAIIAWIVSVALGCYLTFYYLKIHTKKNPKRPSILKNMLLYACPVLIQSLSTTSLYTSDLILVKHFFSSHDAGIYAAVSTLGKIIFFGAGPIGTVMFPLVSQRSARGENYLRIFKYSLFATFVLSLAVLALYWFFPDLAITLLYGKAYTEASGLLVWFGIFMSLFTISSLFVSFGLSLNRTKVVILPLCAAILQIILIFAFHQSLFAVVLASIAVHALLLAMLLIYFSYGKKVPL